MRTIRIDEALIGICANIFIKQDGERKIESRGREGEREREREREREEERERKREGEREGEREG
jgi:hypothetical protein